MKPQSSDRHCSTAVNVLKFQAVMVLGFCLVAFHSLEMMVAIVSGGLISLLSGLIFFIRINRYQGAQYARQIVQSFYRGELLKFAVVIIGFISVFEMSMIGQYTKQYPVIVVVGFALVQSIYWFYPFLRWLKVDKPNETTKLND